MASYRMINQALSGVQFTLTTLANAGSHFLHESLKQIAMRSRERDTMPQLFTPYRFLDNKVAEHPKASVAAPIVPQSRPVDSRPTMSADDLSELSQTAVKSYQFQPRPAFLKNDDSDEHQHNFTSAPRLK